MLLGIPVLFCVSAFCVAVPDHLAPSHFSGSALQSVELSSSDGESNDAFGSSVAVAGDTAVVGAPNATVNSNLQQGAAYVFVKPRDGWKSMTQTAKLTASDGGYAGFFGSTVSISGNTILVTAPGLNGHGAYVFVKPAGGWTDMTETAILTDGMTGDSFGYSSAISGGTIVVGARAGNFNQAGAIYVFLKPPGGWETTSAYSAQLTASDGQFHDFLGQSVATDGNAIFAGAPSAPIGGNNYQGAEYVFVKPISGWITTSKFTAKLTASDGAANDYFGDCTSLSGGAAVIGVPLASRHQMFQGAAYVFVEPSSGWTTGTETAELTGPDGSGGQLGFVSISGKVILAGANNTLGRRGAAFAFLQPEGGWASTSRPNARLLAPDGAPDDYFGQAVALDIGTIVIGAPFTQVGDINPGTAYVFGR